MVDVLLKPFPRKTIIGNAVAHHTTKPWHLLVNRHVMSHQLQIISRRQTAGTSADNRHLLSRGLRPSGLRNRGKIRLVHRRPLQSPDIDGTVQHISPAALFAGMLADHSTGCRERIIFPDQTHRVLVPVRPHQSDISGNIHMGRAEIDTWNRLLERPCTAVLGHMRDIVLPKSMKTGQKQSRRLGPDSTVR